LARAAGFPLDPSATGGSAVLRRIAAGFALA
jgi:hypothetical protein